MLNKNAIQQELNHSIYVQDCKENIGINYIPVTLGDTLKIYDTPTLDVKASNVFRTIPIPETGLLLEPNKLYLGRTNEYTKTYGLVPLLSGLPELAMLGIEIHITAGFGDNGFEGTWTLEIICANPTILYPNMTIGRLYYYSLIGDASIAYQGKYLGQIEPTESRIETEYQHVLTRRHNHVNK